MKLKIMFFIGVLLLAATLGYSGTDTIPSRSTGQVITADWSNLFKRVLTQDLFPRNSSGVTTDKAGSLGSTTYGWSSVVTDAAKLRSLTNTTISLVAPSPLPSSYALTMPSALPSPDPLLLIAAPSGAVTFGQVGTLQIADGAVTSAKIPSGAVGSSQVTDGAITRPKLSALAQVESAGCGSFHTTSTGYTAVTNLSLGITTTGRPIFVALVPVSGSASSYSCVLAAATPVTLRIVRDSSVEVVISRCFSTSQYEGATSPLFTIDPIGSGYHTYSVSVATNAAGNAADVTNLKLVAFEL